jgi:hypothetical protein
MNFTKLDSSEMKQVQGGGLTVSLLKSLEDNIGSPVIVTVLELVDRGADSAVDRLLGRGGVVSLDDRINQIVKDIV